VKIYTSFRMPTRMIGSAITPWYRARPVGTAHSHVPRPAGRPIEVALSVEVAAHSGEALTFVQLQAAGTPAPPPGKGNAYVPLVVDGIFGSQTIKAMQWKLGVTADGPSRHSKRTSAPARTASGAG
jgi:hypothetical protein